MKNKYLLPLMACMAIALLIGCESELDEVKPVKTTEVTNEKLADTNGFVTKLFFPKDPDK